LLLFLSFLCYVIAMIIEQTVEITADRRIILEVPLEVPAGKAQVLIQFPVRDEMQATIPPEAKGCMNHPEFRDALSRAQGAWKDNPWTNHVDDVRVMREEWEKREN
jgi:hypothetical protein